MEELFLLYDVWILSGGRWRRWSTEAFPQFVDAEVDNLKCYFDDACKILHGHTPDWIEAADSARHLTKRH